MNMAERVFEEVRTLPEFELREVLDFVGYLKSRHGLSAVTAPLVRVTRYTCPKTDIMHLGNPFRADVYFSSICQRPCSNPAEPRTYANKIGHDCLETLARWAIENLHRDARSQQVSRKMACKNAEFREWGGGEVNR